MHYLQIFQEALWVLRAFIHLRGGWGDSFIFRGGMKNPGWHWSLWNGNVINLFFKRWPSIIKLFYEGNYCVNLLLHWFIKTYFQQWWQESYFVSKSQDDLYVQSYSCWSHNTNLILTMQWTKTWVPWLLAGASARAPTVYLDFMRFWFLICRWELVIFTALPFLLSSSFCISVRHHKINE